MREEESMDQGENETRAYTPTGQEEFTDQRAAELVEWATPANHQKLIETQDNLFKYFTEPWSTQS